MDEIKGRLSDVERVAGAIVDYNTVISAQLSMPELMSARGTLSDINVIAGTIADASVILSAQLTIPKRAGAVSYDGEYTVIPAAHAETVLLTNGLMMTDNVTVTQVPYFETSNEYGETVYIASEV